MVDDETQGNLQFGPFELSSKERVLRREGEVLPLGSRALDILIYLAGRPGEVIAKQELIDHASHGDQHSPFRIMRDAGADEEEPNSVYGEADEEHHDD